jgi:TIGR03009 family protein
MAQQTIRSPGAGNQGAGNQGAGNQGAGNQGAGNQGVGRQSVAPPSTAYGNRAAPGAPIQPAQPVAGAPSTAQGNTNLNPNLNQVMNPVPPGGKTPGIGSGKEITTADPYFKNPMTPQEVDYLEKILAHWEQSTANITHYSCKFRRWQYNSSDNFVEQLASELKADIRTLHTSAAAGTVKYMAPDKGMFKIDNLVSMTGKTTAGKAEYKEFDTRFGEWWVCDGKQVYEYDRTRKRCTKHALPPDMQGSAILDSPMPFMFGVKAAKIKERYWTRILPSPRDDLYVVEAYPKFQSDAVNYDHVQIYLDRQQFLPMLLFKYNTNHVDEQGKVLKDDREVFEFSEREKNLNLLQKINANVFGQEFVPMKIPSDWEVIEVPYANSAPSDIRSAAVPPPQLGPSNNAQNPPKR